MIPLSHQQYAQIDAVAVKNILSKYKIDYTTYWDSLQAFPTISQKKVKIASNLDSVYCFNGIPGVIAKIGDDLQYLIQTGGLTLKQFLEFNHIASLLKGKILSSSLYNLKSN